MLRWLLILAISLLAPGHFPCAAAPEETPKPPGAAPDEAPVEKAPGEEDPDEEAAGQGPAQGPGADPDEKPALPPRAIDPRIKAGRAGMALLPGGTFKMGTTAAERYALLSGRNEETKAEFLFESPAHDVTLKPFYYSLQECSNAQYLKFLQDTAMATFDTGSGGTSTLEQITATVYSVTKEEQRNPKYRASWQLYLANKAVIWAALSNKHDKLLKKYPDGKVDERGTFNAMRHEPLPRGTKLSYCKRRPPDHWEGMEPAKDKLNHPVRGMSGLDAFAFAVWAGLHVQTEQEFEYAARGPYRTTTTTGGEGASTTKVSGRDPYPWGSVWLNTADRCNWGSKITNKRYEATTVPVDGLPAGRSWCGALNLLGNVAEWTSTHFYPYPGTKPADIAKNMFFNGRIFTLRGGSARDIELPVIRSAYRNWKGNSSAGPPYPGNRYPWVGFRTAAYLEPGRDQLATILSKVTPRRKVREKWIDLANYRGAVNRNWAEPGEVVENGVYVKGKSHSVVFIPLDTFLHGESAADARKLWEKPARARRISSLSKHSATRVPVFPIGLLHTDIGLVDLESIRPMTEKEREAHVKARRRKKWLRPPTKEGGKLPGGTYILAYWHGDMCIANESLEFLAFLPKQARQKSQLHVGRMKPDEVPPVGFNLDLDLEELKVTWTMPLGGERPDGKTYVSVDATFTLDGAGLGACGGEWELPPKPAAPPPADAPDAPK